MPENDERTLPSFIYGTAWKKEATSDCVRRALEAGFRAIDTANQPRHYEEPLVGQVVARLPVSRESVWLQTKFTPVKGHDHRIPYDPEADLSTQVCQSFDASLEHLQTDYVDSYLLHGPYAFPGLGDADWEVWQAIETIYRSGRAKSIGVSNVNALQLAALVDGAEVAPMAVQNRCFANRGWDREVRAICRTNDITYQGFSLLTANPRVLAHPDVGRIAQRLEVHPAQVVFRFAMQVGIVPLTGTTSESHMREDLGVYGLELSAEETARFESIEA